MSFQGIRGGDNDVAVTMPLQTPRRARQNRLLMFIVVVVCFFAYFNFGFRILRKSETAESTNQLLVMDGGFHHSVGHDSIDKIHKLGLPHVGVIIYVVRRLHGPEGKLQFLLLKRSKTSITCPSTWSILGEHAMPAEKALDTGLRGLREEVGLFADEASVHYSSSCMFDYEYGVEARRTDTGKRRDHQLTHIGFYQQDTRQVVDIDEDETTSIMWLSAPELYERTFKKHNNVFDFCSEDMAQLYREGLVKICADERLKLLGNCDLPTEAVEAQGKFCQDSFDEESAENLFKLHEGLETK